jgi:uncharacterized protein YbaR (Trm112 family)
MFMCSRCARYNGECFPEGIYCPDCRAKLIVEREAELERERALLLAWAPRPCGFCDRSFLPVKLWQVYCSPNCRLKAHRRRQREQRQQAASAA